MRRITRTNRFLVAAALSLYGIAAHGYDFKVDGICYNKKSGTECKVTYEHVPYYYSSYPPYYYPNYRDAYDNLSGEIVIPSSVEYDGTEYSVTSIGSSAFSNCDGLTSVDIPNSVTSIGYEAFYGCTGLTSVNIPNSVTSIGYDAFYGCTGLTSVTIGNSVTSIGDEAFYGCTGLTSVTIGNSVTSIGDEAFYDCDGLTSVTIGTSVQSIGDGAFYSSSPLDKLILLPNTMPENIGGAFYRDISGYYYRRVHRTYVANDNYSGSYLGEIKKLDYLSSMFEVGGVRYVPVSPSERTCTAIDCTYSPEDTSIVIGRTVSYSGVEMKVVELNPYTLSRNDNIKSIEVSATAEIPEYFATDCDSLQTIKIGSSVTDIGKSAFYGSMDAVTDGQITLDNSGSIGASAFEECDGLQILKIGTTVTDIGESAFSESMDAVTDGQITLDNSGSIKDDVFYRCTGLTSAKLSESINSIGALAFYGCTRLQEVNIPSGVTSIKESCFKDCSSLASVTLPEKLISIGGSAFYGSGLKSIVIPAATTNIMGGAFYECDSLVCFVAEDGEQELRMGYGDYSDDYGMFRVSPLKEVKIGRNLVYDTSEYYGYSPFYRVTTLETVELTDIPTEVFTNEFYGCSSLKKVSIGDGVTRIGNYAFSGCTSLESFSFGAGMDSIGDEAFSDCTAMTELYAEPSVPPTCGTQALDDINKWNCKLYVPEGAADGYRAADQWKEFFFVESHDFADAVGGVAATPEADAPYRIYRLDGTAVRTGRGKPDFGGLPKGIYVVNGKKVLVQ